MTLESSQLYDKGETEDRGEEKHKIRPATEKVVARVVEVVTEHDVRNGLREITKKRKALW